MSFGKYLGIVLSMFLFAFSATSTLAATINVASGSSIQSAINAAQSGDTIFVRVGQYQESVRISKDNIKVKCEQSRKCIVKQFGVWGSSNTIEGFRLTGGQIAGLDIRQQNNTLKDIEIDNILYGSGDANGVIFFGSGHIFDNIYIHDIDQYHMEPKPHQDCFQTWDVPERGGAASFITITNVLCDMPQTGGEFTSKALQSSGESHHWTVRNFISLAPMACLFYDEAYNIDISHSTFIGRGTQPQGCKFLDLTDAPAPHDNKMTYNIFQNITGYHVIYETDDAVQSSNNCFWQTYPRTPEPGDVYANPLLNSDWSVPANSPCIKMGASLSVAPVPTLIATPTVKLGDSNGDNLVNDADYSIWLSNYNKALSGATNGDFNNSGKVDGVDYVTWRNGYGK